MRAFLILLLPLIAACSTTIQSGTSFVTLEDGSRLQVVGGTIQSTTAPPTSGLVMMKCPAQGQPGECTQVPFAFAQGVNPLVGIAPAAIGAAGFVGGMAVLRPARISNNETNNINAAGGNSAGSQATANPSVSGVTANAEGGVATANPSVSGITASAEGGDGGNASASPSLSSSAIASPNIKNEAEGGLGFGGQGYGGQGFGGDATAYGGKANASANPTALGFGGTSISDADASANSKAYGGIGFGGNGGDTTNACGSHSSFCGAH